ncbi:branched-chain amino acid ABC transporter permease [Spirochaetota bacterium]
MDIKRSYYEDIQLLNSKTKKVWFTALLVVMAILPFVIPGYYLNDVNYIIINIIVAVGLNILVGFTGQVSLGHAGFFAIGAYSTALFAKAFPAVPFIFPLIIAAFIAAIFGFILGIPSLKLEGPYLAIATLGFGMAIIQILGRFSFFGGRQGFSVEEVKFLTGLIYGTGLFTLSFAKDLNMYIIIIFFAITLTLIARNLTKTKVGRAFIAIRDSDIAAQTMGVNITYYKTLSFAISAFYTGLAGGLYAYWLGFINPDSFDFILSILFLAMVVVGGVGTISGSIMGGIVISFLNMNLKQDIILSIPLLGDLLKYITTKWMHVGGIASISFIIFGLILIVIVIFEPLGLFGFWIRIKKYWKTWPF